MKAGGIGFIVLLMCMVQASLAQAVPPAVQAKSEYMMADKLYNGRDYAGAIAHAETARTVLGKSNSRIEYMLTRAYFYIGQYSQAMIAVEAFFKLTPEAESGSPAYNEMIEFYSQIETESKRMNECLGLRERVLAVIAAKLALHKAYKEQDDQLALEYENQRNIVRRCSDECAKKWNNNLTRRCNQNKCNPLADQLLPPISKVREKIEHEWRAQDSKITDEGYNVVELLKKNISSSLSQAKTPAFEMSNFAYLSIEKPRSLPVCR